MNNGFNKYDKAFFGHPKPLSSLFFVELWERFSYYGIQPLLILYMAAMISDGGMGLDRPTASAIIGIFAGSLYLITTFGGWIADRWLGQAKSLWYGTLIIALGHLSIALDALFNQFFFYLGLVFIVLGSGLFKTCIAVMIGSLYSAKDSRRDAGFSIFYMSVNIGAMIAPLFTGLLAENYGWHWGFGIGGIGMLFSLLVFKFISIPQLTHFNNLQQSKNSYTQAINPYNNAAKIVFSFIIILTILIACITFGIITINVISVLQYLAAITIIILISYFTYLLLFSKMNKQEKKQIFVCLLLIIAATLFKSALIQSSTSVTFFVNDLIDRSILGFNVPTAWFYSINPIFVVLFSPILGALWIVLGQKNKDPSSISKFSIALFFATLSFFILYLASNTLIANNGNPISPLWIVSFYFFLTIGELCLAPVGLSSMTKLSPNQIQGQIMGLWCTAAALGGMIAGLIGGQVSAENLNNLPSIFLQSTIALLIGAIILFVIKKPVAKLISPCQETS